MRIPGPEAVIAFGVAFTLSGCAGYTPRISKQDQPTASDAYLYGRFAIDAPEVILGLDGHASMGFVISCRSGETYTIRFSVKEPLQVIKIVPATCMLTGFIYTDADGIVRGRKSAPEELMQAVTYEPGTAYYLGDFGVHFIPGYQSGYWHIASVRDDYAQTTVELESTFPNLGTLPRENRMIGK